MNNNHRKRYRDFRNNMKEESGTENEDSSLQHTLMQENLEIRYYDNADMMRIFKISARTLLRWRKNGIVPYYTLAGKHIYVPSEVHEAVLKMRNN